MLYKKMVTKKSEARGSKPLPLNKSKGVTTGFYIKKENIDILKQEEIKQERSLSWLVNYAIENVYGWGEDGR